MTELTIDSPDVAARAAELELKPPGRPCPGFVCIVREDPQGRTKVLLDKKYAKKQRAVMAEGRILAVGEPILHPAGEWIQSPVKVGDRVITQGFNAFATHKISDYDDVIFEFLAFNQIAGVLDETAEEDLTPTAKLLMGALDEAPPVLSEETE